MGPAGICPQSLAKSTTASVCPVLVKTPPFLATQGKRCPGRRKSDGCASGARQTSIVFALSNAEIPVVTPYFSAASILTVKAVFILSVFCSTICGSSIFSAISDETARQIKPFAFSAINFMISGVTI